MSCEDNTVYCYCEQGSDTKHERTDLCAVTEPNVVERHVEEPEFEEPEVEEPSHVHEEHIHEEPVRSRNNSKTSCHAEPVEEKHEPVVESVVEPVAEKHEPVNEPIVEPEPENHHCHKENHHNGEHHHHHKSHHHNGEHHHKSHHHHHSHESHQHSHDDKPKNVRPLIQPDFTQQQHPIKKDVDENDWAAKNQGRGKIKNLISMFDNGAVLNDKLGNSTSAYKTDYGVGQGKKIRQDVFH